MKKKTRLEVLLWSIAFPGFGQYLNGQLVKGTVFVVLEIIINLNSHFNKAIMLSFQWQIEQAINSVNYQWLMFYPCIYLFAIWDAFKHASAHDIPPYSFFPFVLSAYTVTIGIMYSNEITIFGKLFGPVWLPMLFLIPGLIIGFLLSSMLKSIHKTKTI